MAVLTLSQHIFDAVQASLKRLQVDYIDVLQCALPLLPTQFLPGVTSAE